MRNAADAFPTGCRSRRGGLFRDAHRTWPLPRDLPGRTGRATCLQVEDYALLRAANLALEQGYEWFRVTERATRQNGYSGTSLSLGFGGVSYGRHSAAAADVGTGVPLSGGPALVTTLEVIMGKGPKPADGDVYDARGVQHAIGARA